MVPLSTTRNETKYSEQGRNCQTFAADLFGTAHVSSTYGGLYTGKGLASVLAGPAVSWAASAFTWRDVILLMCLASALDSWLALGVLKPLLRRRSVAL